MSVSFPSAMMVGIEKLLSQHDITPSQLRSSWKKLSLSYRTHSPQPRLTFVDSCAYLLGRLPSTFAVCHQIFGDLFERGGVPRSLIDLGAGPGTVAWAAKMIWPTLSNVTCVERDGIFGKIGKSLLSDPQVNWIFKDVSQILETNDSFEWAVMSYSLGEQLEERQKQWVDRAISIAAHGVIIIEPGTPQGFASVLRARQQLVKQGLTLIAPCPTEEICFLSEKQV